MLVANFTVSSLRLIYDTTSGGAPLDYSRLGKEGVGQDVSDGHHEDSRHDQLHLEGLWCRGVVLSLERMKSAHPSTSVPRNSLSTHAQEKTLRELKKNRGHRVRSTREQKGKDYMTEEQPFIS